MGNFGFAKGFCKVFICKTFARKLCKPFAQEKLCKTFAHKVLVQRFCKVYLVQMVYKAFMQRFCKETLCKSLAQVLYFFANPLRIQKLCKPFSLQSFCKVYTKLLRRVCKAFANFQFVRASFYMLKDNDNGTFILLLMCLQ